MPISTLVRTPLTSQQIADFMLSADRDRRDALAAHDYARAADHMAEIERLARLLD